MIVEVFSMHDRFASTAVVESASLLGAVLTPFLDRSVLVYNSFLMLI
jgi:hypothetical protein